MSSAEFSLAERPVVQRRRRFAVAWRNTTLRQIHAVGVLTFDGLIYQFRYLASARHLPGFRPFIGFPRLDDVYSSSRLWPFFALRAMDKRRPDFGSYVDRLGLTRDASTLDILSRSGGEMQGDVTVNLVEEPPIHADGSTECFFLVRGARHATDHYGSIGAADDLRSGDRLVLLQDPTNPVNGEALLVATEDNRPVGWVPDLLAPYFQALAQSQSDLSVARNNGSGAAWHLRLLVRAFGRVDPALEVFSGPQWSAESNSD